MISTTRFGSSVAPERSELAPNLLVIPQSSARGSSAAFDISESALNLLIVPQSSADFRPDGPIPETLADLLPHVSKDAQRRWGKTFKLIVDWQGTPADQIPLMHLFTRLTMEGFRPFLTGLAYLENTIVFHRKGLGYLRKLAAGFGVPVDPIYRVKWLEVMQKAKENHCLVMAEYFEARYENPADIPPAEVKRLGEDLVKTGQKRMAGARKCKSKFLYVLRQCGYIKNQTTAAARQKDYGVPLDRLRLPLQTEVRELRAWLLPDSNTEDANQWCSNFDLYGSEPETDFEGLREKTADAVVGTICRLYGFVTKECHQTGYESLEKLMQPKVLWCYREWLIKVRKLTGGSLRTMFGTLFSTLRQYPAAAGFNLTWTKAFIKSLPKTTQKERNLRKGDRIVPFRSLELIPDQIRTELNARIAHHKRAQRAEEKRQKSRNGSSTDEKLNRARLTRLRRIASLAQQELIIRFLTVVVWRNENLCECRVERDGEKPANLWEGPIVLVPGMEIPEWTQELLQDKPDAHLYQIAFSADETKAGRPVNAILPKSLIAATREFVEVYRKILVLGVEAPPHTLFVNQAGGSMTSQQMEEAVEEATLRHAKKYVNPHLFRDIYAMEFLRANDADYLTLSKILWHESIEVTIRTYSWIFNESVGTNAAGKWAEERELQERFRKAGVNVQRRHRQTGHVPSQPALGTHARHAEGGRKGDR